MSDFDGNAFEMPEHRPADDGMIDAALARGPRGEAVDPLSSFVSTVRSAVEAVPTPSTAMAAVLAAGFSTEKGDLPVTAASNVNGPAGQESGLSKWRTIKMKIQGFLAGLGVAGKVALGVGVAAAATTGAGATGMLPFTAHGKSHAHHPSVVVSPSSTTAAPNVMPLVAHTRRASATHHHMNVLRIATGGHAGTISSAHSTAPTTTEVVTPTTVEPPVPTPTPTPTTVPAPETTVPKTETPTTVYIPPVTTTTTATTSTTSPPVAPPTQSIQLSCSRTGTTQVTCTWSASPTSVAKYSLWRWTTGGDGSDYGSIYETPDGLTFVDNNATGGAYTYRVFTTLGNGGSGPWSNKNYVT